MFSINQDEDNHIQFDVVDEKLVVTVKMWGLVHMDVELNKNQANRLAHYILELTATGEIK